MNAEQVLDAILANTCPTGIGAEGRSAYDWKDLQTEDLRFFKLDLHCNEVKIKARISRGLDDLPHYDILEFELTGG